MFIRLFLVIFLIPLQSCSNSEIGEKLENSFDINDQEIMVVKTSSNLKKPNERREIKSIKKVDNNQPDNIKETPIYLQDKSVKKSTKLIRKEIFKPQPYRVILKLSGANPSAPAETVTKALRKAGVQFEVEKIERFNEDSLLKNTSSMKR